MVTASRRSTTVQDIPYNISALPGDELETLGIQDLSDVVRLVPGLLPAAQWPSIWMKRRWILT